MARLEAVARSLSDKPAGPARPAASSESEADVAVRLDAVISRLDRVLEG